MRPKNSGNLMSFTSPANSNSTLLETLFFSQSTTVRVANILVAFLMGVVCSGTLAMGLLIFPLQQSIHTLINSRRPD